MRDKGTDLFRALIALTVLCACSQAYAEDVSFNVSMSKESYVPGEDMVLNYEVNNPTDKKVTYKCMVTYEPPTSNTPGCILKEVTLEPGQTFTGSILSTAEFAVETGAQVKLIDENDVVISTQTIPIIHVKETVKPECGNSLCDAGEDHKTCPGDCKSGERDGYCDKITDALCDPDCGRTEDEDCICNSDNTCEKGLETYKKCASECPSGSSDGYCDGMSEGICDPDCGIEQDPDCNKTDNMSYLPYAAIGLIILSAVGFLGHKKSEARKIEEKKEEFLKWKQEN